MMVAGFRDLVLQELGLSSPITIRRHWAYFFLKDISKSVCFHYCYLWFPIETSIKHQEWRSSGPNPIPIPRWCHCVVARRFAAFWCLAQISCSPTFGTDAESPGTSTACHPALRWCKQGGKGGEFPRVMARNTSCV